MLPLLALVLSADPASVTVTPAVDLAAITPGQAAGLRGQLVRATFTVGAPPCSVAGVTLLGPGDDGTDIERRAVVPQNDAVDEGDTVTVVGVLTVTRVTGAWVRTEWVPPYTEIRVRR